MTTMDMFHYTKEDVENEADSIKAIIVDALIKDGLLDKEDGEEWAVNHTIVLRKKSIFRVLSDIWQREKESNTYLFLVVSK
jgi:hypothetical protein